jgi:hypothetical protein
MKWLHMVSFILLVVGGLNWLLVAFGYNVVEMFGSTIAQIVYILVGLAAVYEAVTHKGNCRTCGSGDGM